MRSRNSRSGSRARRAAAGGDRAARAEVRAIREQILQSGALHRAVAPAGQTPPGSVFKVLTLLHALERGVVRPEETMDCRLGPRSSFGCHTHGMLDLWGAVEKSCNHYCYETVQRFSQSRDAATVELLDLFKTFGLFDAVPGSISAAEGAPTNTCCAAVPTIRATPRSDRGVLTFAPVRVAGVAASIAAGAWCARGS
jgi:penicillin-binding protein 2